MDEGGDITGKQKNNRVITEGFHIQRAVQVVLFYMMLLWLGSILLIGNFVALPLLLTPNAFRRPLAQWSISAIFRLFLGGAVACGLMRLDLRALDRLNRERQMLLVANHPSMIDIFLILSRVRRAVCIMKAGIGSNIFLGVGARLAGYVSNREANLMIRGAIAAVSQGDLLLAFPEGTRTTRQPLNEIKRTASLIAKRADAPLQIIVLRTNSLYLSKGWRIWKPPQFPLIYQARLGPRLQASRNLAENAQSLQACFERELSSSIDPELRI